MNIYNSDVFQNLQTILKTTFENIVLGKVVMEFDFFNDLRHLQDSSQMRKLMNKYYYEFKIKNCKYVT